MKAGHNKHWRPGIRSSIFLWVFAATVVPLTLLVLVVTAWSERQHIHQVDRQMQSGLDYLVSELERRLTFERDVIEALAVSPALRRFVEVLGAVEDGDTSRLDTLRRQREALTGFLEEFQAVFLDVGTIRVLDRDANTLIKVRFGSRMSEDVSGIKPYRYAESEAVDDFFSGEIRDLPPGKVSYVLLPPSRNDYGFAGQAPMLDAIVPLQNAFGEVVGYLMVNSSGVQIDRILELSPRFYHTRLLVAEINPDLPERDGMLLYDEGSNLNFSTAHQTERSLRELSPALYQKVLEESNGAMTDPAGEWRYYYTEFLPYPDQLISWILVMQVPQAEIIAPFRRIRMAILLFAATALVLGLLLANLGARRLGNPIVELTANLRAFARGEPLKPMRPVRIRELRDLQVAFEDMARTTREAEQKRDQAERMLLQSAKLASLGELAAGVGHELNNPLNNIKGLLSLMRRELREHPELLADLEAVEEETDRATRIVRGVLDFARQRPPHYQSIDLPHLIDESLALVQQTASDQGVHLSTLVDPRLSVQGDPTQLQQVLINILINAIHASESGDEVVVETHRLPDGQVQISVCDEGTGIPDEVMERMFDPFFTTKEVGEGSGLGLSISLGIIEQHGGSISVHNNAYGGATVVIRLPIEPPDRPT
ncbi:MAG: HAMP domain-containing protein [Gammaproteobacteria bacterium]|nr:MAG: HAMP domain-containing protein [Gammaproteobacteria bacterium]